MGRVAQGVEDRAKVGIDRVGLHPDVGRRQHDVVRERSVPVDPDPDGVDAHVAPTGPAVATVSTDDVSFTCLLYTSDAADERSSVDLGGRRIIKKNNGRSMSESPCCHITIEQNSNL